MLAYLAESRLRSTKSMKVSSSFVSKIRYYFESCKHFPIFLLSGGSSPHPPRCISMVIDYSAPAIKKISRRPAILKHKNNRRRAAIIFLSPCPGEGKGVWG